MSQLPGSPTYRLRLHTGPVKNAQRSVARQLKRSKIRVAVTGTEHIYADIKANSCEDAQMRLAKALQKKGLRRLSTQAWSASCQRRSTAGSGHGKRQKIPIMPGLNGRRKRRR